MSEFELPFINLTDGVTECAEVEMDTSVTEYTEVETGTSVTEYPEVETGTSVTNSDVVPKITIYSRTLINVYCLVLDMDGTLLDFTKPPLSQSNRFSMFAPPEPEPVARPYLREFLQYVFKYFKKVSIWTAGTLSWYNKCFQKVLSSCIPEGKGFDFVYTRNHFAYVRVVKPLTLVYANSPEYNPLNTIIIDDNPNTYELNRKNAIGIKPFYYDLIEQKYLNDLDNYDFELLKLIKVLQRKISGDLIDTKILLYERLIPQTEEDKKRELKELKLYVTNLLN